VADHVTVINHVEGLARKCFGYGIRHTGNATPANELHLGRVQLDAMRCKTDSPRFFQKKSRARADFEQLPRGRILAQDAKSMAGVQPLVIFGGQMGSGGDMGVVMAVEVGDLVPRGTRRDVNQPAAATLAAGEAVFLDGGGMSRPRRRNAAYRLHAEQDTSLEKAEVTRAISRSADRPAWPPGSAPRRRKYRRRRTRR